MAAKAPAPAAQERKEDKDKCGEWFSLAFWVLVFVVVALGAASWEEPVYHVTISTVASLNPATDLARPALSSVFNLTVRIDPGLWGDACLDLGSAVAVSYHRVPLAAAAILSKLCAGPAPRSRDRSVSVVARGNGVRLPGAVVDALAWDMRGFGGAAGRAEFEVTLTVPYESRWKLVSCRAKVGGIAALQPPCDVSVVGSVVPAPQAAAGVGILDVAKPEKGGAVSAD